MKIPQRGCLDLVPKLIKIRYLRVTVVIRPPRRLPASRPKGEGFIPGGNSLNQGIRVQPSLCGNRVKPPAHLTNVTSFDSKYFTSQNTSLKLAVNPAWFGILKIEGKNEIFAREGCYPAAFSVLPAVFSVLPRRETP
jgi:hypothetical protein